jgi:hypothetical protein
MKTANKKHKIYKIRDMQTGKFQVAGSRLGWAATGKVWHSMSPLKNHFLRVMRRNLISTAQASLWEIVEYDLVETGCYSAGSLLASKKELK